jgi:hypothetical protein
VGNKCWLVIGREEEKIETIIQKGKWLPLAAAKYLPLLLAIR